jgi:two-component sensor histidine kinase
MWLRSDPFDSLLSGAEGRGSDPLSNIDVASCTTLPPSALSPLAAREFTRETLDRWEVSNIYDVVLVVNELVTNAVQHSNGVVMLGLGRRPDGVRVAVRDDSSATPSRRRHDLESLGGRGLALVASLSTDWGVSDRLGGKIVWADMSVSSIAEPRLRTRGT